MLLTIMFLSIAICHIFFVKILTPLQPGKSLIFFTREPREGLPVCCLYFSKSNSPQLGSSFGFHFILVAHFALVFKENVKEGGKRYQTNVYILQIFQVLWTLLGTSHASSLMQKIFILIQPHLPYKQGGDRSDTKSAVMAVKAASLLC